MSNSKYCILYVRNISNRAKRRSLQCPNSVKGIINQKQEEIRHLFAKYGSIYDLTVPLDYYSGRMKGYAFVHYNHSSDAKEAHKRLDGTEFLGRAIEIEFARGQRRTPAEMMRLEGQGGGDFGRDKDRAARRSSRSRSRSRGRRRSRSPHDDKIKSDSMSKDNNKKKSSSSTSRRRKSPESPPPPPPQRSPESPHRRNGKRSRESRSRSR